MVAVLAAFLIAGTYISASLRFFGTHRSVSVTGVSPLFTWLGLAGNACWLTYGITTDITLALFGAVWTALFIYIWWRLQDRRIFTRANLLVPVALSIGAALSLITGPAAAGWVAGSIVTASTVPQTWRVWATRDIHGVVPFAWAWSACMSTLWITYGALQSLAPVAITNGVYLTVVLALLAGALRTRVRPATTSAEPAEVPA